MFHVRSPEYTCMTIMQAHHPAMYNIIRTYRRTAPHGLQIQVLIGWTTILRRILTQASFADGYSLNLNPFFLPQSDLGANQAARSSNLTINT
jgi:hypothetical protein